MDTSAREPEYLRPQTHTLEPTLLRSADQDEKLTLVGRDPPALLTGYLVDHELAIHIAKASYDDLVGPNAFSKTAGGIIDS